MKQKTDNHRYEIDSNLSIHFDKYMGDYIYLYDDLAEVVKKKITSKDPIILDIGSGSGILLTRINRIIPKAALIGIDASHEMCVLAQKRINEFHQQRKLVIEATSSFLPVGNRVVDVVLSRFSLCYWSNPHQSLSEIYRILKPGGIFVLEAINKNFSNYKLFLTKINMFFHHAKSDVIRYHMDSYERAYALEEIKHLLTDQSFLIIHATKKKNQWKNTLIAQKPKK